jgi:hypothetical protein
VAATNIVAFWNEKNITTKPNRSYFANIFVRKSKGGRPCGT